MNSQYNGFDPYYGAPAPAPQREPFFRRLLSSAEYKPFRELFMTSFLIGLAFVAYPACSSIFSYILGSVPGLAERYMNDVTFGYLCDMAYSIFCVGLPFLLVYVMLSAAGLYRNLLPLEKPRSAAGAFLLVIASLGLCFFGNLATSYLTSFLQGIGIDSYSYQQALAGEPLPEDLLAFLIYAGRTAVIPAIVEEFAFRGVVLESLRKYGDWFAIVISAVMFGLMHGNVLQVPFALIAGLALGYSYVVTGTLWTSVIIHFFNNFISVLFTMVNAGLGDGAGMIFSLAATYGFMFLGLLAMIVYGLRNRNFARLYPSVYPGQKKKALAFFAAPTTIAAICVLIKYINDDIIR